LNRPADRDAALESVLRRLPPPELSDEPTVDDCLDAETIAAMADGTMVPLARELADAHAATCSRCQAVLVAVIRTAPPATPKSSWWRARSAVWLAPLAAAGAAVVLWVAVDVHRGSRTADPLVSRTARAELPTLASQDRAPSVPPAAPGAKPEPQDALSSALSEAKPAAPGRAKPSAAPLAQAAPVPAPSVAADAPAASTVAAEPLASVMAGPPGPPPQAPPPPEATLQAASPRPIANSAPARRADAAALADSVRAFSRGGAAGVVAKASSARTDVASPDPRSRWRFTGSVVERSTDAGVTWTPQVTGSDALLIAGSSPQPNVCWLAGAAGTVLVSVDGLTWQRLAPPASSSILSIAASSADAAVVTTSDGSAYATADRGLTWSPRQ
jgi:translation initiation factor IF-2